MDMLEYLGGVRHLLYDEVGYILPALSFFYLSAKFNSTFLLGLALFSALSGVILLYLHDRTPAIIEKRADEMKNPTDAALFTEWYNTLKEEPRIIFLAAFQPPLVILSMWALFPLVQGGDTTGFLLFIGSLYYLLKRLLGILSSESFTETSRRLIAQE